MSQLHARPVASIAPSGGAHVARTLRELGVEVVFSVSGNQILPVYEGAVEAGLRIVHMRHESACAYAAAASAELGGGLGAMLVSAGPAFLAALTGVAVARSYELPILFLSGHTATTGIGSGGFQDLDLEAIAREVCKASFVVTDVSSIAPILQQAAAIAREGVPGPVHVALPGDTMLQTGIAASAEPVPRAAALDSEVRTQLEAIGRRLEAAARPLVVVRPAALRGEAGTALATLVKTLGIAPFVAESPRGSQDLKFRVFADRFSESDFALIIGPADFTVGFLDTKAIARNGELALVDTENDPAPLRAPVIHVRASPESALPIVAASATHSSAQRDWQALFAQPKLEAQPADDGHGGMHPLEVARALHALLPADVPIALDGGEFCQWTRLGLASMPNLVMWNSRFGAIGGSIAQSLGMVASGAETAVAILGDGAAGYHLTELETAAREGLRTIVLIGNDSRWAAEWHMLVERYGPASAEATMLSNADYGQAARGLGAAGYTASTPAELRHAVSAALKGNGPACINVLIRSVRSPAVAP